MESTLVTLKSCRGEHHGRGRRGRCVSQGMNCPHPQSAGGTSSPSVSAAMPAAAGRDVAGCASKLRTGREGSALPASNASRSAKSRCPCSSAS
eukprot:scaffold4229_cov67-Phaeocystis_antarctica.AAC.1